MKERFQIYRLAVPPVPAGGVRLGIPLELESDAPFTLRGISFCGLDPRFGQDATVLVRWRGPNGMYRQSDFVPVRVICPNSSNTLLYSHGSAWRPLYPETTWPEGSTIDVDVLNAQGAPLSGFVILFRGVKQFSDSVEIPGASQYPPVVSGNVFDLSRFLHLPDVGTLDNIAINAPPDAAVAIRTILLTVASKTQDTSFEWYWDLKCQILDANHKSYMNQDVEVPWVMGCGPGGTFSPIYPQIWLPPSGIMYLRFVRNDPGQGDLDFNVVFKASKVFQR